MIYLSGAKNVRIKQELATGQVGLLLTPATRYDLDGVAVWAMDNGAFTNRYPGDEQFLEFLDKYNAHKERCLFVAAPDVVGDAETTLSLFPSMARRIKERGWPVALVGQDGMERMDVPWELVDWLFVGGSTEWKLSHNAEQLINRAKAQGKLVHIGRVNSRRRFDHFTEMGCDSCDGTFLAFGPDKNYSRLIEWLNRPSGQTTIFGGSVT